jgi:predicted metal-binding membrane protein
LTQSAHRADQNRRWHQEFSAFERQPDVDLGKRIAPRLISAGLYQWTPIKEACLSYCQAPLTFILRHGGFRGDPLGALTLGLRHGLYCVGCCWALMALLFVGGVMNIFWIAALAILVLLEKVIPSGRIISRVAGLACMAGGTWMLTL